MIEQKYNLWQAWGREDKDGAPPMARWVTATRDGDLVLHGSPVSAAHVLRKLLWDEVDSVVMTSATLTGGGDFQSLAIDNGIPEEAGKNGRGAGRGRGLWEGGRVGGSGQRHTKKQS